MKMCEAVGLKSETIKGYVRDFDFFPGDTLYRAEHAWSTVNIDDKWALMDITWGAGYIEPKKQIIKKALWLLFEKPYEVEFHYVHKYNPNWFHVDPPKMVTSHLPTFDFFQFLKNPISIKDFQKGRDAVLSKDLLVENATSPALKEYLYMGDMQRLALENTISKKNVPVKVKKKAKKLWGNVDILINNAGGPPPGKLLEQSDSNWDKAINTNLLSTVRFSRAVIPSMRKKKWGRIISISSTIAKEPSPAMILSATSRAGVMSFSKVMAIEFAEYNITTNVISPGGVFTNRLINLIQKY